MARAIDPCRLSRREREREREREANLIARGGEKARDVLKIEEGRRREGGLDAGTGRESNIRKEMLVCVCRYTCAHAIFFFERERKGELLLVLV